MDWPALEMALGPVVVLGGLIVLVLWLRFWLRKRAEQRAGYATLDRYDPRLWQLDSETGAVVQEPVRQV